ncbi:unnamed protein product, partial [marine sediment metagenome]
IPSAASYLTSIASPIKKPLNTQFLSFFEV